MANSEVEAKGEGAGSMARAFEFIVLFVAGPAAVARWMPKMGLIPSILVFGMICLTLLLCDETFDRRQLWNGRGAKRELARIFLIGVVGAVGVTGLVLLFVPASFLSLPRERPWLWLAIMLGYPLASVYPQEVIFRAFIFHRYRELFGRWGSAGMVVVSAAAFGYVHIVLNNWLAVAATLVGGVLFGWTYARSKSLAATGLEHAMYGCFMFTVGLGSYFYNGAWG